MHEVVNKLQYSNTKNSKKHINKHIVTYCNILFLVVFNLLHVNYIISTEII